MYRTAPTDKVRLEYPRQFVLIYKFSGIIIVVLNLQVLHRITFYLIHNIIEFAIDILQLLLVLHCKIRVLILTNCREQVKDLHTIMATVNTSVKSIRLINAENGVYYRVEFNSEFDAIVLSNGEYIDAKVNYINFTPKALVAQVLNSVPGADILYARRHEFAVRNGTADFGIAEISAILRGANISLEREKFEAGSEYNVEDEVRTHEYAGYNTQISSIAVAPRVAAQMDKLMDSILSI